VDRPDVDAEVAATRPIRERIAARASRGAARVEEIAAELASPLTMDSTEEDIVREMQVRSSLDMLLEKLRLEAVVEPVREQYGDELRALTEAEQDSKQLKSAKRHLLFDRIIEERRASVPGRPGDRRGRGPDGQGRLTKQFVKKAPRRSTSSSSARRSPSRSGVRTARHGGDPADRVRGAVSRARTARRSSPAARRRS
jgi:hypothetical protein